MKTVVKHLSVFTLIIGSCLLLTSFHAIVNPYERVIQEYRLDSKMEQYGVPGISFAVIRNGELAWAKGYGVLQKGAPEKVNTETMFSVGSVSKVGTAVMTLKLCTQDMLSLDADVNTYISSWKVDENQYTKEEPVTLRKIMSHTAGLTVHGFADYLPHEELPTTVETLEGSGPAKNGPVYVDIPVGSTYRYSGGGTTIEQLIIEEQTNKAFHKAAYDILFQPLQMNRSSYRNPLPSTLGNIAKAHNGGGTPVALPRGYQAMPEAAASGLWTTPSDLAKMLNMLMQAYHGQHDFLPRETVQDMMTPVAPSTYGLGPRIKEEGGTLEFYHGGANDSYRAHFSGFLENQNGVVIFTNGRMGSELINELVPLFSAILK